MNAPAQSDSVKVDVGLSRARRVGGHPVLAFDADKPHPLSVRARAFIFSDPRSRALIPLIEKTAPSNANVLIVGETGTGKELVARYVHSLSHRARALKELMAKLQAL